MSPDLVGRLQGQVAIVTGAGRGIGRAEARLLALEGASVVVNDVGSDIAGLGQNDGNVAETVADEIRKLGGRAVASVESVATMEGAQRIVAMAMETFGRLDILINNAGIVRPNLVHQMSEDEWDSVVATHLRGHFCTIRQVAPIFRAQASGVIVNTASPSGLGHYGMSNYAAAKEGIVGLTRSVARELGPYNIRCNAIRPMAMTRMAAPEIWETVRVSQEEFGFPGIGDQWIRPRSVENTPDSVAALAVWLCTPAARNANGCTFMIAGAQVGLYSEPSLIRAAMSSGGWSLDALDDPDTREYLIGDLENRFRGFDEHTKASRGRVRDRQEGQDHE